MLGKLENERLTQVRPGTQMGDLIRRYWIPAMPAWKVGAPNDPPVRLRLAGQNFIIWRDADGQLGLFDEQCMHRGASLALGHCEGNGLRCIYHGWKFATDGTILETPNYRRDNLKEKLRAPVHPVREAGGIIWTYLGPVEKEPPFPHYKFMDAAAEELPIYYGTVDCNFVQLMEGTLDPAHAHVLHQDPDKLGSRYVKTVDISPDEPVTELLGDVYTGAVEAAEFVSEDSAPECEVEDTLFGCHGVAIHDAVADGRAAKYGRVHTWVMPFLVLPLTNSFVFSVPIDDDRAALLAVLGPPMSDKVARDRLVNMQAGPASNYDKDHYHWTDQETWGQDRAARPESFTGIEGVIPEDLAVSLSMGPIYDRSNENLVPADRLVMRMRQRLLATSRNLQEGVEPFHLESEDGLLLGGEMQLLHDSSEWRDTIVPQSEPFWILKS